METTSRTCRWVRRRLPLLVGGELAVLDRRRVERHLIGCAGCRDRRVASHDSLTMLQELATLNPIASGTPAGAASPSVWPALARQIRESRHQSQHASGFQQIRSWGGSAGRFAARSGLAASLVCAAAWLWTVVNPAPRPPAAVVSREGPRHLDPVVEPIAAVAVSDLAGNAGDGGLAPSPASLDRLDHLASRADQRSAALPDGKPLRDLAVARPGVNPFEPPLPLHLDFDLDRGTLATPAARDTQRAY